MHPFDAAKPPQLAVLLGYAGLVHSLVVHWESG